MELLYQDEHILICVKPVGLDAETGVPNQLAQQLGGPPPLCVHRLDQGVGGVMVYARTKAAAAGLSRLIAAGRLEKTYLAVVRGVPAAASGTLRDLLYHDSRTNKTFVVNRERKGVKEAVLDYETLQTVQTQAGPLTLVRVGLHTGRSHQIRVQFAARKLPLVGDGRYGGAGDGAIALWSWRLRFLHPITGKPVEAEKSPAAAPSFLPFLRVY